MTQPYDKSFPVSWDQLHRDARALAWRLAEAGPFDGLIAITRGGMVPAAIVARELGIRMVDTVAVVSYDHQSQNKINVIKHISRRMLDGRDGGKGLLIVDDLVDTGGTVKVVREIVPNAHYATVYAKPAGRPEVDTFITEVSQDTWVFFPWDLSLQFAQPINKDDPG